MAADIEQMVVEGRTQFLNCTVLEAAEARIARIARTHDNLVVLFTSGKDSQLVLELVRRVYDKLGWTDKPVRFTFLDMELFEDEVIRTAESYFDNPRFEGVWLAAPQAEFMAVMNERKRVILWDRARMADWGREPPPFAFTTVPGRDAEPFERADQYRALMACMDAQWGLTGSIALLQGHRFGENPIIRRNILAKDPDDCWIFRDASGMVGVDFVRPIYDWSIKDVFKFFYDTGIPYCASYDINMHVGGELRAGTPPLDMGRSGKIETLRESYPTLFTQVTRIWPELLTQERYAADVDYEAVARDYDGTWGGMARYIAEAIPSPGNRAMAAKAVKEARNRRERGRLRGKHKGPCYGMPLLHIWRALVSGAYRSGIDELNNPPKRHEDFEAWVERSNRP